MLVIVLMTRQPKKLKKRSGRLLEVPYKSPEWYTMRDTCIGSSDIGAIAGLNKFCTPYDVWCEKKGLKTGQGFGQGESGYDQAALGSHLESFILNKMRVELINREELHKDTIAYVGSVWGDEENKRLICSTDCEAFTPSGLKLILEAKTAKIFFNEEWKAGVPPSYYAQVQWQLGITGYDKAYIGCLVAGDVSKFYVHEIERDEYYIARLREIATSFIEMLDNNIPPKATAKDLGNDNLKPLPLEEREVVSLNVSDSGEDVMETFRRYAGLYQLRKTGELTLNQEKELKNLKAEIFQLLIISKGDVAELDGYLFIRKGSRLNVVPKEPKE